MQTIKLQGKDYAPVNERVKAFRTEHPDYSLTSEIISNDNGVCVMRASILDEKGTVRATGHASEKEGSSNVNKTSYIENCETSAWGRALANLGYGIDGSIASADELMNALKQQDEQIQKDKDEWEEAEKILMDKGAMLGMDPLQVQAFMSSSCKGAQYFTLTIEQMRKGIEHFDKKIKEQSK